MKIKPLYDRVVLVPDKVQEKTVSGIMLPEVARVKSQLGTVVAVGQGGALDGNEHKIQVKVGDRVLYAKFSGTEVRIDEEDFLIVRQTDVLAVIGGKEVEVKENENE